MPNSEKSYLFSNFNQSELRQKPESDQKRGTYQQSQNHKAKSTKYNTPTLKRKAPLTLLNYFFVLF